MVIAHKKEIKFKQKTIDFAQKHDILFPERSRRGFSCGRNAVRTGQMRAEKGVRSEKFLATRRHKVHAVRITEILRKERITTMIMNPTAIKHVVVDGHSLTLESFVAISRYNATVELAPAALEAMQKSRALAEKIAAEGRVAYGITTGFGEFQKVAVPKEMSNQLSTNLILSHCTAAGEPYADEIVRGMMLLRANALCGGVSGVRSC